MGYGSRLPAGSTEGESPDHQYRRTTFPSSFDFPSYPLSECRHYPFRRNWRVPFRVKNPLTKGLVNSPGFSSLRLLPYQRVTSGPE